MRNTKEVMPILTAIFCLNRVGAKDKQIDLICDYAFRRLFGANTNLLTIACIEKQRKVNELLEKETAYKKYLEEYKK